MAPPDPLWFLLVPPESRPKKLTSEFMDAVLSERTYTDPARWVRFLWYARFVRVLCIVTSDDLESKHRELVYALMEHNGGASPFPSLLDLQWCPSSYSDSSYFPLFTRQMCVAAFRIPRPTQEHPYRLEEDPESHIFLTRLQAASPRLCFLAVDASWQRLGDHHIRAICSFDGLVDLDLTASLSMSSFRELAAIPHLKYLKAGQVLSDTDSDTVTRALASPAGGLSHPAARISAPRLQLLSLSGDCHLLAALFAALCAPNLKTAAFTAVCRDPHPPTVGYVPCLEAVAAFGTLEELQVALHAPVPRERVHLAALLDPLLPLRGLAHFLLMSANRDGRGRARGLWLVASDADFAALARAWPRLRTLRFMDVYWDASRADDGHEGGAEGEGGPGGDGPGEAGGIAIPRRGLTPTPEVLRLFRDHCPDLWQLMLPYLSLDGGVPQLDLVAQDSAPPHVLRRLVFGATTDATGNPGGDEGERERAREGKVARVLADDKAEEWARYILGLFPNLNEERSIAECVSLSATSTSGWIEVLQRVRELRSSGRSSESASLGGMVAELTGQ
ncbi:hypothetical protein GSI_12264 [Ganoderma sinense ZZ0214-1]|uniref:Uncharacterized protein n=1 Tax=Ganoderma sinense ZZ0214-1 TaxID=1077348 RepID=A0A2G8RYB3_9APHY|nr:hypothetical protein GSI_12264 [Ganoderma sinense ZZ0214-1]